MTAPLPQLGVATPQANPTVEPELHSALGTRARLLVTRSTGQGDSRQRLLDYIHGLDAALASFGGMPLDAFGFACTASSYLLPAGEEADRIEALEQKMGYPIITAAAAIHDALAALGAHRIALGSPYPSWIHDTSRAWWTTQGYEVVASRSVSPDMGDTRAIYALNPDAAARDLVDGLESGEADVVLITGTGLPTLQHLNRLEQAFGKPVINSNLCLAWAMLRAAGADPGTDFLRTAGGSSG